MKTTAYLLMSKDKVVLHFLCERNEFDEPIFSILRWENTALAPIGFFSEGQPKDVQDDWLTAFLESRKAPKHRRHIQEILTQYRCNDLKGFIDVTHAVSLNDVFWVKGEGSALTWADVSLYRNEFDQLISIAAFDGTMSSTVLSSSSPEFGTDGYYAKCWVREDERIFLYKRGSELFETEQYSEYLAYQVASRICPNAIPYDLALYHGQVVSKCELFTNEDVGLVKAARVFGNEKPIPAMLSYFESIGSADTFRRMCILDAIILNPDRHYGNFGVLFDTDTMKVLRMAPVFDNNRALLPHLDEDQLADPAVHIKRCRPRLGSDFIVTARGLMTDDIRNNLEAMRGFTFAQHPSIEMSQVRSTLLDRIVQQRISDILD